MVTNVIAEIDTITAVVACVVHGLGASIAPWSALKETAGEVVAVPFGEPQIHRQIGLIERRASPRAAVIDRLHQHLFSFSGEYGMAR
ncbi:LysR substrate-binding domain-containing protein [Shinella sp. M31]|uniref:LysR substrate-binding domain-containing protein n=1 Tax=Shinella sp. M31 TaxID=3368615 RepID=UPI003B9E389D